MMCGTADDRVLEFGATAAVCENGRKNRVLDVNIWLFLRRGPLNLLAGRCNWDGVPVIWGVMRT